jgi:hypothetical protein
MFHAIALNPLEAASGRRSAVSATAGESFLGYEPVKFA